MAGFNLTAQIQLQAPTNTSNVANQIQRDLGNVNVNVNVQANQRAMSGVNSSLQSIRSNAAASSKGISTLNRNLAESARRFSVITVATGTFIAFARSIKNSIGAAISFEREMIKISQVTGKSVGQLEDLSREVTRISTSFGVANQTLLETARVLTQAGLSAKKTKEALQVLANTTLAPTFDNIRDTAEGAIAILNQFGREAAKVGQDIKFLEQSLDAINAVSKRFAVESADLITAVRRTGGVFQAAGGQINELIALFTSVRATTRESAETIATGFRTIFTRIQRSETIDQLKELGIELTDVEGKFIGPLKAIEALSVGLAGLDPRDVRFNEIVEQLGGFRQIGKVIPLLKQFATAQNALSVANASGGSTARDAIIAQKSLAVQFVKVKEQFDALVRTLAGSDSFRGLATTAIQLASAFLKFAESLEKVLPQLMTLAALKIGRNIAPGLMMLAGGRGRSGGGVVSRFAQGGMVPGSGNRDTVPAMLTPGEFVIRKSSVKKMGADKLAQMNGNRFASGGPADFKSSRPFINVSKTSLTKDKKTNFDPGVHRFNREDSIDFDRTKSHKIDVKKLNQRRKDVKNYLAQTTAQMRGIAFEGVAKKELKLDKVAGGNSRIDASGPGGQIYEIKSELEALTNRKLGEKMIGAGISPLSGIDKNVQKRLKKQKLSRGHDPVNLGRVGVIQDITGGLGKEPKKKKKALGGLIQKFALGGIAKVSKVGAAILQEDQGLKNQQFNVGVTDVKKAVGGGSGSAGSKLRKGVGSQFKGKKYTLVAQGLGKTTSEGFREALIDGVATGLDTATGSLSADLGLGQATLDSGSRNEFKSYVGKRPMVGDLFEAALSSLSGKGAFKESQVSAPFDFPGGLQGAVKDNYNKLPPSWIDARSSSTNATADKFKTKVTNELADEYKRIAAPAASKKAAKGGSIAGSDTVPAMLTPGEFVFSKSASQQIGYSTLNKMNKQGVSGYVNGGVVGTASNQVFGGYDNAYGPVAPAAQAPSGGESQIQILTQILATNRSASQTLTTIDGTTNSIKTYTKSAARRLVQIKRILNNTKSAETDSDTKDATKDTSDEIVALGGELDSMARIICECIRELKGKDLSGGDGGGGGDGGTQSSGGGFNVRGAAGAVAGGVQAAGNFAAAPFKAFSKGIDMVSSGLQRLSSGLIAITLISGTVIQTMGGMAESQKKQIQAGLNNVSVLAAIGAEVIAFGLGIVSAVAGLIAYGIGVAAAAAATGIMAAASLAGAVASAAHTAVLIASTVAQTAETGVTLSLTTVLAALGIEVATLTGAIIPIIVVVGALAVALGALVVVLGSAVMALTAWVTSLAAAAGGPAMAGITMMGIVAFKVAAQMEAMDQAVERFNNRADKILEDVGEGRDTSTSRDEFIELSRRSARASFERSALDAKQFNVPGFGKGGPFSDTLLGRGYGAGTDIYDQNKQRFQTEDFNGAVGAMQNVSGAAESVSTGLNVFSDALWYFTGGNGPLQQVGNTALSFMTGFLGSTAKSTQNITDDMGATAITFSEFTKLLEAGDDVIARFLYEISNFTNEVGDIAAGFAGVTYDSTKALASFNDALKRAETEGLSALAKAEVRASGAGGLLKNTDVQRERLDALRQRKEAVTGRAAKEGLVILDSSGGLEETGNISENKTEAEAQKRRIAESKVLSKEYNDAQAAFNKLLEQGLAQEANLRQDIMAATGERVQELVKSGDVSGAIGAESLGKIGPEADRFRASLALVKAELDNVIKANFDEKIRQDPGNEASLLQEMEASQKKYKKELDKAAISQLIGAQKNLRARTLEELALIANKNALDDVNNSLKGLNIYLLGASRSAQILANLDDEIAKVKGEFTKPLKIDTAAFDIPLEQLSLEDFNKSLEQAMNAMTPKGLAAPLQDAAEKEVQRMAKRLETAKFLTDNLDSLKVDIGRGQENLLGLDLDKVGELAGNPQQKKAVYDSIIQSLKDANLSTEVVDSALKNFLNKALDDGNFGADDSEELNKVLNDSVKEIRVAQKAYVEQINKFVEGMDKLSKAVIEAENRLADARGLVVDVEERSAGRIAEFTGQARNKDEIEAGRRRAADARLGADARGFGARAGNVGATAAAAKAARAKAQKLNEQAAAELKKGNKDAAKDIKHEANQAANAYKRSTDELKRMTDQSARASDAMAKVGELQAKMEKLKAAFDQTKSFLQDFAFGTNEQRGETMKAFQDLGNAMRQGSMRGATGEQRGRIGGILDQLSDVTFATGETGAQMKGRFATQELMDMGFDPQFAAIAGQEFAKGPIQKQILDELKKIGAEEAAAAEELAKLQYIETQEMRGLREELGKNFDKDLSAAIGKALAESNQKAAAARESLEKELNGTLATVDVSLAENSIKLDNLNSSIQALDESITKLLTARQEKGQEIADNPLDDKEVTAGLNRDRVGYKARLHLPQRMSHDGRSRFGNTRQRMKAFAQKGGQALDLDSKELNVPEMRIAHNLANKNKQYASSDISATKVDEMVELAKQQLLTNLHEKMNLDDVDLTAFEKMMDPIFNDSAFIATIQQRVKDSIKLSDTKVEIDGNEVSVIDATDFAQAVRKAIKETIFNPMLKSLREQGKDGKGGKSKGKARGGRIGYYNQGGVAGMFEPKGTDTIPAMLSKGEYVINAKAAKKIGYGKLNQMNYMKRGGAAGGGANQMDQMFGMAKRLQRMGLPVGPHSKGGIDPRTFYTKGDKEIIKQFGKYSESQVREINRLGYFTKEQSDMLRQAGFNPENIVLDPATQKIFEDFGKEISPELVRALTDTKQLGKDPGKNLFDPKSFTNPLQGPLQQSANAAGQSSKLLLDLIRCVCGETELTKSILDEQKKQTQQKASDAFKSAWDSVKKGFASLFGVGKGGKGGKDNKGLFGMRGGRFVNRAKYGLGTGSRDSRAVRARKLGQPVPKYLQFPGGHGGRQGMWMPGGGGGAGGGVSGGKGKGKGFAGHMKDAWSSAMAGMQGLKSMPGGGQAKTQVSILGVLKAILKCVCGVDLDAVSGGGITSKIPEWMKQIPVFIAKIPEIIKKVPEYIKKIPEYIKKVPDFIKKVPEVVKAGVDWLGEQSEKAQKRRGKSDQEAANEMQRQQGKELGGPYDRSLKDPGVGAGGDGPRLRIADQHGTQRIAMDATPPKGVSPGSLITDDPKDPANIDLSKPVVEATKESTKTTKSFLDQIKSGEVGQGGKKKEFSPGLKTTQLGIPQQQQQPEPAFGNFYGVGAGGDGPRLRTADQHGTPRIAMDATPPKGVSPGSLITDDPVLTGSDLDSKTLASVETLKRNQIADAKLAEQLKPPSRKEQLMERAASDPMFVTGELTADEVRQARGQAPIPQSTGPVPVHKEGPLKGVYNPADDPVITKINSTTAAEDALAEAKKAYEAKAFKDGEKIKPSEMSKDERSEVSGLRKDYHAAQKEVDPQAYALKRARVMAGKDGSFEQARNDTKATRDRQEKEKAQAMDRDKSFITSGTAKYDQTGKLKDTHTQDQVRELRRMESNMRTSSTRKLQTGDGVKSTKFEDRTEDKTKGKEGGSWLGGARKAAGGFLDQLLGGPVKGRRSSSEVRKMKAEQKAGQAAGGDKFAQMQLTKQDSVLSVLQDIRGILAQCCGVSGGGGMGGGMGGGVIAQAFPTGPPQTDPRYAPDQYQYGMSSFASPDGRTHQSLGVASHIPPGQQGGVFGGTPEMGKQMDLTGIADPICACVNNLGAALLEPLKNVGQMTEQFAAMIEALNTGGTDQTAQAAGPFEMNHTFSGELTIAVKMPDDSAQQIQKVLGEALQTYIEGLVPDWVKGIKDSIFGAQGD